MKWFETNDKQITVKLCDISAVTWRIKAIDTQLCIPEKAKVVHLYLVGGQIITLNGHDCAEFRKLWILSSGA